MSTGSTSTATRSTTWRSRASSDRDDLEGPRALGRGDLDDIPGPGADERLGDGRLDGQPPGRRVGVDGRDERVGQRLAAAAVRQLDLAPERDGAAAGGVAGVHDL